MLPPKARRALDPCQRPSKRVWCVRHGQAEHNVLMDQGRSQEGRNLPDPHLSSDGIRQARSIVEESPIFRSALCSRPNECAELVVSSPCWRALQTAREACNAARALGVKVPRILAHPDLQECGEYPCDTGQPLSVLQPEFPEVDFSLLAPCANDWFIKPGVKSGGIPLLLKRCENFTDWLASRPEARVVVVAHSTLFAFMLEVDFANCEVIEVGHLWAPRAAAPEAVEGPEPWRRRWRIEQAADRVVPFYSSKGTRITMHGSPPLSGTLKTCYEVRGERSAKATAQRAGMEFPLWMSMGVA
uniref:Phosphoglycerate mutase-like protein n=1 Tax=Alexandrium monilatum TaxID=311494 RepID=A0A7S4QNL7_9DINO